MVRKLPLMCRIFGHKLPRVFTWTYWGGVGCYFRMCDRRQCDYVHYVSEVEFERKYAGR